MSDNLFDAVLESQANAQRIGETVMGMKVRDWAEKHATDIPLDAMRELMDIVTGKK